MEFFKRPFRSLVAAITRAVTWADLVSTVAALVAAGGAWWVALEIDVPVVTATLWTVAALMVVSNGVHALIPYITDRFRGFLPVRLDDAYGGIIPKSAPDDDVDPVVGYVYLPDLELINRSDTTMKLDFEFTCRLNGKNLMQQSVCRLSPLQRGEDAEKAKITPMPVTVEAYDDAKATLLFRIRELEAQVYNMPADIADHHEIRITDRITEESRRFTNIPLYFDRDRSFHLPTRAKSRQSESDTEADADPPAESEDL